MKKLFLSGAVLSVFALVSCAGSPSASGDYKKCSYLSIDDEVLVSEEGTTKVCKMVSTYSLTFEDHAQIDELYLNSFPSKFAIYKTYVIEANAPINPVPVEPEEAYTLALAFVSGGVTTYYTYQLGLDYNSTTVYESYGEYYYSEASETVKVIAHNDVKTVDAAPDYSSAYLASAPINEVVVVCEEDQLPSSNYRFNTPLYEIKTVDYERFIKVDDGIVSYSFEE